MGGKGSVYLTSAYIAALSATQGYIGQNI